MAVAARLGIAAARVARAVLARGLLGETSLGVACALGHVLYKGVRFFIRMLRLKVHPNAGIQEMVSGKTIGSSISLRIVATP